MLITRNELHEYDNQTIYLCILLFSPVVVTMSNEDDVDASKMPRRACHTLRMDLKDCLLRSDCVQIVRLYYSRMFLMHKLP